MRVLVTGATGNVGSRVVRDLRGRGVEVRAFVRDPEAAAARLGDGVELAAGDLSDPRSVRRAVAGVERVFLSSGDSPAKPAQEAAVVDAAAEAGVELVVKASTLLADPSSPLAPLAWNGASEERLRASGVPWVVLRSAFYMTNLLAAAEAVRAEGRLVAPAGEARIAMIDPRDAGSAGAAILAGEGHAGRVYDLTGPEAVTYARIAEELSGALGRPVEFVDVPGEAARQGLLAAGLPDWLADHVVGAFARFREGAMERVTPTVRELTGREPRSVGEWAREHAAAFGGAAPVAAAAS